MTQSTYFIIYFADSRVRYETYDEVLEALSEAATDIGSVASKVIEYDLDDTPTITYRPKYLAQLIWTEYSNERV